MIVLLVASFFEVTFAQQSRPKSFASGSQAAQALYDGVRNNDDNAVRAILGAGPELASSGDEAIDKLEREQFAQKYQEMHRLVREPDGYTVLYIGAENWPFPIPLIGNNSKWRFDPDAGAGEIAARRIGENETIAIQVCQDLGRATGANADQNASGNATIEFARELVAHNPAITQSFHGYKFRIGSEQSVGAVVVAYPIQYRVSGVMTLIVLPGGSIYEKDLGSETATLALKMNGKPASGWVPVQ
jgi:hypothetical protein